MDTTSNINVIIFLLFILASSVYSHATCAKELTFATDYWCPYICELNSEKPGILVESIQHILSTTQYEPKFKNINWARSISEVRKGNIEALLATYISDAPDFIYGSQHFMDSEMCFFVESKDNWQYQGVISLNARRIIFMNGYSYGTIFDNYILNNETVGERNLVRVSGIDGEERRISMMERGWADTIVEDRLVFKHMLKKQGKVGHYRIAGCLAKEHVYVGFSPNNAFSSQYSTLVSNGIEQMKDSGEFERITRRYINESR